MSSTSFGAATDAGMVGSSLQPFGYLFGGWTGSTQSISRKIYSTAKDFSSVLSLSACSSNDYSVYGTETTTACPPPRLKSALWIVQENYLFVFGGVDLTLLL
jgi:hypothetical protein